MPSRASTGLLAGAVLAAALAAAPVTLYAWGVSPTGIVEEAVGYPYFFSLRIAFGGEHPWLPQAQLTTLIAAALQWGLSAAGYAADSLLPRIDLFSLLAALLAAACTWLAAVWASAQLRSAGCTLLVLASALVLFSSPAQMLPGGPMWTIQPAYYVWVIPLLLVCLGLIARPTPDVAGGESKAILQAAVLAGVAAGIKLNFVVFPLAVILAKSSRRAARALIAAPLVAAATYLLIVACYCHFEWNPVGQHLFTLAAFIRGQRHTMAGAASVWSGGMADVLLALVFLLPLGTIGVGWATRSQEPAAVGLAGLLSVGSATQRLYTHTLVETFAFAVLEIGVAIWAVDRSRDLRRSRAFTGAALTVFVAAALLFGIRTRPQLVYMRDYFEGINAASSDWREAMARSGKPVLILTTDNEFHPNSVESSLCKGGTDIANSAWGTSPYIAGLFPRFHCATSKAEIPSPQDRVVGYARRAEETPEQARRRVEGYFGTSLADHVCQETPSPDSLVLVHCVPREATSPPGSPGRRAT